jgi:DNA-binding NarL/FixJ family response regulator
MSSKKKIHIFLIEDSEIYSVMLHRMLEDARNFVVYSFTEAEEALRNSYLKPDVIVMDYYLPNLSGREAIECLKRKNPQTPIIVISSQVDKKLKTDTLQAGASELMIKKSFTGVGLIASIQTLTEEKERQLKKDTKLKMIRNAFVLSLLLIPPAALFLFYFLNT